MDLGGGRRQPASQRDFSRRLGAGPIHVVGLPPARGLWDWLDAIRKQGFEALAIPHNGNASDGLMFAWLDSASGYIDRKYAEQRQANEPLSEISQNKGLRKPIRYCPQTTSSPTTRFTTTWRETGVMPAARVAHICVTR